MRPLRMCSVAACLLAAALPLVACKEGPPGPQGAAGERGPVGEQGPAGNTAAIEALAARVAAIETQSLGKQPHLVAYAGTPQEIDLGPFVDWEHAWSEQLGVYYRVQPRVMYYMDGDCTGQAMLHNSAPGYTATYRRAIALVEKGSEYRIVQAGSHFGLRGCERDDPPIQAEIRTPFVDTGASNPVIDSPADYSAQLR